MLESLSIRSFRLIASLDLEFESGLTILSGETGAGKSILLEALALTLGTRAETSMIRKDCPQASVTAGFALPKNHEIWDFLEEKGIESEDNHLILKRILKKDGGSRAFVQGQSINLSLLREIGQLLADIHGQLDRLFQASDQLKILDLYGECDQTQRAVETAYDTWQAAKIRQETLRQERQSAEQQQAFIDYSLEELEKWAPFASNEEALLVEKRQRLSHQEKLMETLQASYDVLEGHEGIRPLLNQFGRHVERIENILGEAAKPLKSITKTLFAEFEEAEQWLSTTLQNTEDQNHESLEALDDRLQALRHIARKHHVNIDALGALQEKFQAQKHLLEDTLFEETNAQEAIDKAFQIYQEKSQELFEKRLKAARKLERDVKQQLPELKLEHVLFFIQDSTLNPPFFNRQGMHQFTFWLETNKSMPPGLLHQIASGGEMSRFLLILKNSLNHTHGINTLVFDEIESGTGGAVAQAIGSKLQAISKQTQVLAITHSPQLAVYADHHFKIEKEDSAEHTTTQVLHLTHEEHLEEIARMLSGEIITQEARAAALQLKQAC